MNCLQKDPVWDRIAAYKNLMFTRNKTYIPLLVLSTMEYILVHQEKISHLLVLSRKKWFAYDIHIDGVGFIYPSTMLASTTTLVSSKRLTCNVPSSGGVPPTTSKTQAVSGGCKSRRTKDDQSKKRGKPHKTRLQTHQRLDSTEENTCIHCVHGNISSNQQFCVSSL